MKPLNYGNCGIFLFMDKCRSPNNTSGREHATCDEQSDLAPRVQGLWLRVRANPRPSILTLNPNPLNPKPKVTGVVEQTSFRCQVVVGCQGPGHKQRQAPVTIGYNP